MDVPLLIFDGQCGFCRKWVRRFDAIARGRVGTCAWQDANLSAFGLTEEQCRTAVQFVDSDYGMFGGAAAVSRALRRCGVWWKVVGSVMAIPGIRGVCDAAYRWIAANRHRCRGIA